MKKLSVVMLALVLAFVFVACGDNGNTNESKSKETKSEEKKVEKDFKGDYEDMGNGTIMLSTPSGTSEDGNVPFLFVEKDDQLIQIGLDTSDFDGSKLSYVYVDGMEKDKDQFGDAQSTIDLEKNDLKVGKHKVEVVQYDTDKPDGNVVTYKVAQYEIKEK
ncbi:hypothetical protein HMPREF1635_01945 [Clostridiales bacterium S5-A14a]|nr:hypothetical protein HMPREF1635_01945 [Clostridiales bacterium S5-A14a]